MEEGMAIWYEDKIKEQQLLIQKYEDVIDYVVTAKPTHYHDINNMLDDFKTLIELTLKVE